MNKLKYNDLEKNYKQKILLLLYKFFEISKITPLSSLGNEWSA